MAISSLRRSVTVRRVRDTSVITLGFLGIASAPFNSAAQQGDAISYLLKEPSTFQVGCFGPCDCLVSYVPMAGSFLLTRLSDDWLFTTYAVTEIQWENGSQIPEITGSGIYRVGGEFAVMHEMSLDLSLDGGPRQRFESGLVSGGGDFPSINIDIAAHGFACYDTVLAIRATPDTPVSTDSADRNLRLTWVEPNPFHNAARIHVELPEGGEAHVAVYDVRGQIVRELVCGRRYEPGAHSLMWDGIASDGSRAASGTYFVRAALKGERSVLRIVKLQ
jgi:hypothetical protein